MKFTLIIVVVLAALSVVCAIENRTGGKKINRPKIDIYGFRTRRSSQDGTKGGVKVHPLFDFHPKPKMVSITKGEYECNGKACKLKPGEEPKGCNGVCQYPIQL